MARKLEDSKILKKSVNRVQTVKDFLALNYEIKINVFDTSKSYIICKVKERNCKSPDINYISLHMEEEGVRGCDSILKKLLASPDHMTTFNPIHDYFNSLDGKWKGVSMFDILCSTIMVHNFGDKAPDYYQKRFYRIFKKWLVASIACSMGVKPNDVILGIMSTQGGTGKTSLLEFLVPTELKSFFANSDKQEKYFDINKAFTQNFIINFEELEGIKKSNNETIKKVLSAKWFDIKKMFWERVDRIGNAAFTSNKTQAKGGFMTPEMNDRRYGIAGEVDSIDYNSYKKHVDVDQLWAEMWVLFKSADFDYVWGQEDWDDFKEFNTRYELETDAKKLVRAMYRLPEADDAEDKIIWKQASEVLDELNAAKKITASHHNVNHITIGFALNSIGFERKGVRKGEIVRYGYNLVLKE